VKLNKNKLGKLNKKLKNSKNKHKNKEILFVVPKLLLSQKPNQNQLQLLTKNQTSLPPML
jgi:hypothetical protein